MRSSILNKLFLIICLALILGGCSESAPKISQTFWQINLVHDQSTGRNSQALTIFVMASDDDGVDDMDKMYVINDEHQLYWEISGSSLRMEKYGENEVWMGSSFITMSTPDENIPGGTYRIMLLDSSGERAKTSIVISNNIKGPFHGCVEVKDAPELHLRSTFHLTMIEVVGGKAHDVIVHTILDTQQGNSLRMRLDNTFHERLA